MEKKIGLFEEDNGSKSSTRYIFVIGSIWNMLLCSYLVVFGDIGPTGLIAVYSSIQGVMLGLKLGQKPMEEKGSKK